MSRGAIASYSLMPALIVSFSFAASCYAEGEKRCETPDQPSAAFMEEYQRQTGDERRSRPHVQLAAFDVTHVQQLQNTQTATQLTGLLSGYLSDAGAIVARSDGGATAKTGAPDFAISGEIQNVNFKRREQPATSWTDPKGKVHHESAQYVYETEVSMVLTMTEVRNANRVVFSEALRGERTRNVDASGHRPIEFDEKLVAEALETALKSKVADIQMRLAYKPMVVEVGERSGRKVYRITAGASGGMKEKQKVAVYRIVEKRNEFLGVTERSEQKIGDATVTGEMTDDSAWIAFDDANNDAAVCPKVLYLVSRDFNEGILAKPMAMVNKTAGSLFDRAGKFFQQISSQAEGLGN